MIATCPRWMTWRPGTRDVRSKGQGMPWTDSFDYFATNSECRPILRKKMKKVGVNAGKVLAILQRRLVFFF